MGSGPAFLSARRARIALDDVDAERFEFADQGPERALVVEPLLVLGHLLFAQGWTALGLVETPAL